MTGVVAIDGPGGAGKSTVSRRVAERLDVAHLDTGAYYRAATLASLAAGADPSDVKQVMDAVSEVDIDQRDGRTYINGEDVSDDIRSDLVTATVSAVSAHPLLRLRMVKAQQAWVEEMGGSAVVEGRDIGTVVFPSAALKVFLDADPEVRAARRSGETGAIQEAVAEALRRRDHLDSSREASPLKPAADALVIDTTQLTVDAVVDRVLEHLEAASG